MPTSENICNSVKVSLKLLHFFGFWATGSKNCVTQLLQHLYGGVVFMVILGIYIVTQFMAFIVFWGNLQMMTGIAFIFFTNLSQAVKLGNFVRRKKDIESIIQRLQMGFSKVKDNQEMKVLMDRCNRETGFQQIVYFLLTTTTIVGWAISAEGRNLPLIAWYPFDTTLSPAYDLCYTHQVVAIYMCACLNISKDTLIVTLMAQARCRLQIIGVTLKNLTRDVEWKEHINVIEKFTSKQEAELRSKLKLCLKQHQQTFVIIEDIEKCFSAPTLLQFAISLVIICFTAFTMATMVTARSANVFRIFSMGSYLLNMMYQVFIYCYHGTQLRDESVAILSAAYECSWYRCPKPIKTLLLITMMRSLRPVKLTAGDFSNLSLQTFMAIIKTSYSFFTLLMNMNDEKKKSN